MFKKNLASKDDRIDPLEEEVSNFDRFKTAHHRIWTVAFVLGGFVGFIYPDFFEGSRLWSALNVGFLFCLGATVLSMILIPLITWIFEL